MDYNTQRKQLVMPEYGRIVQEMVDYALTIENREERQQCANTIVAVMSNLFVQQKGVPDFAQKLWNHLAAMSDYQLDIDYPCEISKPADREKAHSRVKYPMQKIRFRHYGHLLETFLQQLRDMPDGEEREQLKKLVISQMKQSLAAWNKDALNNEKVAADIELYTNGQVRLNPEEMRADNRIYGATETLRPVNNGKGKRNRKN